MSENEIEVIEAEPVEEEVKKEPKYRWHTSQMDLLSENQMIFASEVAKGAKLSEAYRKAYPEGKKEAAYVYKYANKLIKNPRIRQEIELLQQAARMRFLLDAPRAAEKMIDLSKEAKSENVQLEATKDILNRAGLQPPQRVETVHVGIFGSASQDDIRNLLRQKIEENREES